MKKIGVSLPWDYLSNGHTHEETVALRNNFGSPETLLILLRELNVTHIELRHRPNWMLEQDMLRVFQIVTEFVTLAPILQQV